MGNSSSFEKMFDLNVGSGRSFIFNMSVGYDLEGIKNSRVDKYINDMMDSSSNETFKSYIEEVTRLIEEGNFLRGTDLEEKLEMLKAVPSLIPAKMCNQITLSTMHGCPPKEIEDICHYMLTEKNFILL